MTLAHVLLFAGGLFHVGLVVFHLMFARLFHWDAELAMMRQAACKLVSRNISTSHSLA